MIREPISAKHRLRELRSELEAYKRRIKELAAKPKLVRLYRQAIVVTQHEIKTLHATRRD